MNKRIVAVYLAWCAALGLISSEPDDRPTFLSAAAAQSEETDAPMMCPKEGRLEEHLAPGATVHIDPGYTVSSHKSRYVTRNGHITVDVCVMLREFTEGEHAERIRVEVKGRSNVVYVYLQERDLERVRR